MLTVAGGASVFNVSAEAESVRGAVGESGKSNDGHAEEFAGEENMDSISKRSSTSMSDCEGDSTYRTY